MKAPIHTLQRMLLRLICFILILTSCSVLSAGVDFKSDEHKEIIRHRVENLDDRLNYCFNAEVDSFVQIYYNQRISVITKSLRRSETYFPYIDSVLVAHNIPWKLRYIAVIESLLDPEAVSPVGATGMWQFMPGTARMYGLEVSDDVDERLDYKKSTIAAVYYLKDLKDQFGDWFLAMAAYNCGPGNIRTHIRRSNGNYCFQKIKHRLPQETYEYVPKFTAISYLMEYAPEYKLVPRRPDVDLIESLPIRNTSMDHETEMASIEISAANKQDLEASSFLSKFWNTLKRRITFIDEGEEI